MLLELGRVTGLLRINIHGKSSTHLDTRVPGS
jgi:hypothetical protein